MLLAGAREHAGEVDAAGESQLIADLVERDRLAEPHDHRLRLRHRRNIERDDQALTRIKAHGAAPRSVAVAAQRAMKRDTGVSIRAVYSLCHEPGGIDELTHQDLELIGRARIRQLIHVVEGVLGIGHRDLLRAAPSARQPTASTWRSASSEWVAPEWPDEAPPSAKTRF